MCVCNVPYLLNVACPLNKVLPSSMLRCYSHTYTRTHARMQLATRHATPGGVLMVSNGRGNNACRKFKRNIYTLACLPFEQAVPMLSDARLPAVEHLLSWHFAGPPGQYSPQSPGRYRRTDLLIGTALSLQASTVLGHQVGTDVQTCWLEIISWLEQSSVSRSVQCSRLEQPSFIRCAVSLIHQVRAVSLIHQVRAVSLIHQVLCSLPAVIRCVQSPCCHGTLWAPPVNVALCSGGGI